MRFASKIVSIIMVVILVLGMIPVVFADGASDTSLDSESEEQYSVSSQTNENLSEDSLTETLALLALTSSSETTVATITSFEAATNTTLGAYVTFNIGIECSDTDITSACLELKAKDESNNTCNVSLNYDNETKKFTGYTYEMETVCTYIVDNIYLNDAQKSSVSYGSFSSIISTYQLVVSASLYDSASPVINSVSLSSSNVLLGEPITVYVGLTDVSTITQLLIDATIILDSGAEEKLYYCEAGSLYPENNGLYAITFDGEFIKYVGTFRIEDIKVKDYYYNQTKLYYPDVLLYSNTCTVSTTEKDTSVQYVDKTTIVRNGMVYSFALSANTPVNNVYVFLQDENDLNDSGGIYCKAQYNSSSGLWNADFSSCSSSFTNDSLYSLYYIQIEDSYKRFSYLYNNACSLTTSNDLEKQYTEHKDLSSLDFVYNPSGNDVYSSSNSLLSLIDTSSITGYTGSETIKVYLKSDSVLSSSLTKAKATVTNAIRNKGYNDAGYYLDISLHALVSGISDNAVQPVSGNKVPVSISLPSGLPTLASGYTRNYYMVHIKSDGTTEILPCTLSGSTLSFETSSFSTFALVYQDVANSSTVDSNTYNWYVSGYKMTSDLAGTIQSVMINNVTINPSYYAVYGNTIVISQSFINSLSPGTYTVYLYDQYTRATGTITIPSSTVFTTVSTNGHTVTSDLLGTVVKVEVNGNVVEASNYTVSGNSITFTPYYMSTLPNGNYTVRLYDNTTYATGSFKVTDKKESSGNLEIKTDLTSVSSVKINNIPVSSQDYTVSDSKVIIKETYLKTLKEGTYEVEISNGNTISKKTFIVDTNGKISVPQTADISLHTYYIGLSGAFLCCIAYFAITKLQRKENELAERIQILNCVDIK